MWTATRVQVDRSLYLFLLIAVLYTTWSKYPVAKVVCRKPAEIMYGQNCGSSIPRPAVFWGNEPVEKRKDLYYHNFLDNLHSCSIDNYFIQRSFRSESIKREADSVDGMTNATAAVPNEDARAEREADMLMHVNTTRKQRGAALCIKSPTSGLSFLPGLRKWVGGGSGVGGGWGGVSEVWTSCDRQAKYIRVFTDVWTAVMS